MYHYLSEPPPGADAVRRDLSTSPGRFEEQLRYLREQGYQSITLYELAAALQRGYPLPDKPIIITFDDGYRDNHTYALPILRQYGFRATFFLLTNRVNEGNPEYLSWEQVVEMSLAGMDMEAHGRSHADLRTKKADGLAWQIRGSREDIEARTHKPVRFFCYPSGKYNKWVTEVMRLEGYWGAVTTKAGVKQRSDQPYELMRIRVRGYDTPQNIANDIAALMREP